MIKNNVGLVEYAINHVGLPYWYGTYGNTSSLSLLEKKQKQYPQYYTSKRIKIAKEKQLGLRVQDCAGLIKGYLWSETPTSAPKYNKSQDKSANGLRNSCSETGSIKTIPEIPGILVFKNGHVGVYICNGEVIEAKGFEYGVVKSKLSKTKWTSWGKLKWIDYNDNSVYYIVKKGDNLIKIAKKYKMNWKDIYNNNKDIIGDNPNLISIGIKLKIK